jgi:hypothetical protein
MDALSKQASNLFSIKPGIEVQVSQCQQWKSAFSPMEIDQTIYEHHLDPPSDKENELTLSRTGQEKASGRSGKTSRISACNGIRSVLKNLFSKCLSDKQLPMAWKSTLCFLYKNQPNTLMATNPC